VAKKEFSESRVELEGLLGEQTIGCLGLSMDGQPYVVPLNYAYLDGRILLHCAWTGKKLDYLKANPHVCFTVARQAPDVRPHDQGDPCHVDSDSVICYGTARVLDDFGEREAALNVFNRRFRPNAEDLAEKRVKRCCCVEIRVTEMTGRRERQEKRTYWRCAFAAT
jgi:nitroimidazol reductase NimA-like FMN-containing flavoprotein (pyridoxamine 5'-phosphate oxidase superfamily)